MSRKLIDGLKDENGAYIKAPVKVVETPNYIDLSLDDLIQKGIRSIYGILKAVEQDVGSGAPARETVMNLRDVMSMLKELKKDEKDYIDKLSNEELENLAKK